MNKWAKKTLRLVNEENYLDKLQTVYPHQDQERDVSGEVLKSIRKSFEAKDDRALLNKLLDLEKFPYKDSYVGFLRKDRTAITRNPETVKRICGRLYAMGIDGVINGATAPKEANTRRGNAFVDWTRNKFKSLGIEAFRASTKGVAILQASDKAALDFCNIELGVGLAKRPDIVAKSGRKYVVGEAKFLSSTGGNQGGGFVDGMGLATNPHGKAYKIFILDGIHWIETGSNQFRQIEHGTAAVFSALLLHEFLNSVH